MPPTNSSDGMPSYKLPSSIFIYSRLIIIEIFIYHKSYHHWSIFINISLHFPSICLNLEGTSLTVIFLIWLSFIITSECATIHDIVLISHAVESGYSFCDKEVDSWNHVASHASKVFKITVNHILRRKGHIYLAFGVNTHSIR